MRKIPFGKALLYIAVVRCRINFEQPSLVEFIRVLNEFFPFICLDSPFNYVNDYLNSLHNIPTSIVTGTYNKNALNKFLKESCLADLHDIFDKENFQDLLYDVDLRKKIDGMCISGFRNGEIELEIKQNIQDIEPVFVKTYINCFANFYDMDFFEKRNFIINSFEDLNEKNMLLKCVENKSRDMIRMILGVRTKTYSPVELINRSAQIVVSKTQEGILENDDLKLQNYLKLGIKIAETLHSFGVGNKDAAKELLDVLNKKVEDNNDIPKPMSVEDLERRFMEQQGESGTGQIIT